MKNRDASLENPAAGLIKDFVFLSGACLIGMTLAAAAIGFAPETTIDPGLKNLAAQEASQEASAPAPSGPQIAAACRLASRQAAMTVTNATDPGRPIVCEE
jgi:hypothetical protein